MEREDKTGSLWRRIRSTDRRAVVVAGPAASGKTTAVLDMYHHYTSGGARRCLLIVPSARAAADLRGRILAASESGVAIAPRVVTFSALAGRILAAAGESAPTLPLFQARLLLRRIVDKLSRSGRLTALASVADTPGLIVTLERAIRELKRAAVEPDSLARAISAGAGKARDLLEVYRSYQEHLSAAGMYDLEGRMWLARDRLSAMMENPDEHVFDGIEAVGVDGFTDFTPTQLDMLAALGGGVDRLVITLTWADDGRRRMWRWTRRTLENIRRALGADLAEIAADRRDASSVFGALWDGVFDFDAATRQPPRGLAVIEAAGIDAEVAAVARRVKRLLLDGAPAGSIAILARSMETYRGVIDRVFAECDIPVAPAPQLLTDAPIIRFALDAASLGPQWLFRDVLRVIKSSYFRPQALAARGKSHLGCERAFGSDSASQKLNKTTDLPAFSFLDSDQNASLSPTEHFHHGLLGDFDESTVAAAEMLIREGNVLEGREAYAKAAERLKRRLLSGIADGEDQDMQLGPLKLSAEQISQASEMLDKLFYAVAGDSTSGRGAAERLASLVDDLELRQVACGHDDPALVARDLRALSALEQVLDDLRRGEESGESAITFSALREALPAVALPAAAGESLVDVMDVLDVRAVRYRHVFLLGLGEGEFPRLFSDNPLIGEFERRAWADRGVVLDSRRDLSAREMLLFYLALSRGDESLTLSYRSCEMGGSSGAPGAFILSLLRLVGGMRGLGDAVEKIGPGRFIPGPGQIASRRDAVNVAMAGLFGESLPDGAEALAWSASMASGRIVRAATGLWAQRRRWRAGDCDAFDGRISDDALLEGLAKRFGDEHVFSARQLETFAQCPWRFFAGDVLELRPLSEPRRMLEAVGRGLFCHEVLNRMFRALQDSPGRAVVLHDLEWTHLAEALDKAIAAVSRRVEYRQPAYPMLWRVQLRQMRLQLMEYLRAQHERGDLAAGSTHFELAFGMAGEGDEGGEGGRIAPVEIDTPVGPMKLRGRIDRIDSVRVGELSGALAVDYKTGSLPGIGDIMAGRSLQAPLYAAAVERIFSRQCLGGVFHRIGGGSAKREQYFAALTSFRGRVKPDAKYEGRLDEVMDKVGRFLEAMRAGRFDVLPSTKCPSYCPLRTICRYSRARAELKGDLS